VLRHIVRLKIRALNAFFCLFEFRYVRCKRQNQTFFIHVSKSDTIKSIKERIGEAAGDEPNMRLLLNEKELADAGTVADYELVNDAEIMIQD